MQLLCNLESGAVNGLQTFFVLKSSTYKLDGKGAYLKEMRMITKIRMIRF